MLGDESLFFVPVDTERPATTKQTTSHQDIKTVVMNH